MPLRSLVEPEEFAELESAFAEAWQLIERSQELDPLRVPAQRERLAYIIVGLWKAGGKVAGPDLPPQAVEQFLSVLAETDAPHGEGDKDDQSKFSTSSASSS